MRTPLKGIIGAVAFGLLVACSPCPRAQEPRARMEMPPPPRVDALRNVYFAVNSAELTTSATETLRRNAQWLRENPDTDVEIQGHTDERGPSSHNKELGMERAMVAARYLESQGIEARRITAVSYGEERPLDPGHTEEAWTRNRRVEFVAGFERSEE